MGYGIGLIHCLCYDLLVNVQIIVEKFLLLRFISLTPMLTLRMVYKINYFFENLTFQGYGMYEIPYKLSFFVRMRCLNRNLSLSFIRFSVSQRTAVRLYVTFVSVTP